jgi:hypothetical protein
MAHDHHTPETPNWKSHWEYADSLGYDSKTTLLKSFGFSDLKSALYQMPCGTFQLTCGIIAGIIASKVPNSPVTVVFLGYVPGRAGVIGIMTILLEHQISVSKD